MTDREKLEMAAKLIEEVTGGMDTSEDECPHCGMKKKLDWDAYKAYQELVPVVNKLHRFAKMADGRWVPVSK